MGDLQTEYARNVRKLGLKPLYPPREDFQVGDVYVQSVPKTPLGSDLQGNPNDVVRVYIGTDYGILSEAEKYLSTRVVFRQTSNSPAAVVSGTKDGAAVTSQSDSYLGRVRIRRDLAVESLPIVAFPEVTADAGYSGSLGLVGVLQSLGLAGAGRTQVTLNFNDVRRYGVPKALITKQAATAGAMAYENLGSEKQVYIDALLQGELSFLKQQMVDRGSSQLGQIEEDSAKRCKRIVVVTEVYLTRMITYTYRNGKITGAALKRAEVGEKPSTASTINTPTSVVINLGPSATQNQAGETGIANADIASVQSSLTSAVNSSAQGLGFQFVSWDALGMKFSKVYERPIAVGWDGYEFSLNPSECLLNMSNQ